MTKVTDQSYPALTIPMAVPAQNSANNVTAADVVGNKLDTAVGTSLYSMLYRLDVDHHGVMNVYPSLGAGIPVVSAAANWTYGVMTEIVPAATIVSIFHIHHVVLEACSDDGVFQLEMCYGAGDTTFMVLRYAQTGGFFGNVNIWTLSSAAIPANSRIRARLASSDGLANQCTQSLSVAYRVVL